MIEGNYPTGGYKYLTVARLTELLKELPDDARIVCNTITRNLTVVMEDGTTAMIDFIGKGEIENYS